MLYIISTLVELDFGTSIRNLPLHFLESVKNLPGYPTLGGVALPKADQPGGNTT
jgi:hypothetical protein